MTSLTNNTILTNTLRMLTISVITIKQFIKVIDWHNTSQNKVLRVFTQWVNILHASTHQNSACTRREWATCTRSRFSCVSICSHASRNSGLIVIGQCWPLTNQTLIVTVILLVGWVWVGSSSWSSRFTGWLTGVLINRLTNQVFPTWLWLGLCNKS